MTLVALIAAAAAGAEGSFDPVTAARLPLRVFRDRDGLPQNTVHAITFDRHGQLWIGTQDGAAVSSGRGWQIVNMPGRMRSNFVRAILAARDGSLWFGTQGGGLYRLREGRWEELPHPCPPPSGSRVNVLLESLDPPAIWAGTHECGVARWDGAGWELFGSERGLPSQEVWGLLASPADGTTPASLWAGTARGVAVLPPGGARFLPESAFPPVSANSFLEQRTSEGVEIWVGTYGFGLYRRRAGVWTALGEQDGLPSPFITSLASHGGKGPVWVGTDGGGLAAVRDGRVEVIESVSGLPSNAVYSLSAAGPERGGKTLWIGTRGGGLVRLVLGRWWSLLESGDHSPLPITALLVDDRTPEARVWFGTDGGGLARLDRRGWTRFLAAPGGLPSNTVQCLLQTLDQRGTVTLWVGTRHGGLATLAGNRWTVFDQGGGALPNDMVQALAQRRGENGSAELWVGTRGGLAVLKQNRWHHHVAPHPLPHSSVQVLAESNDAAGIPTMWVGTADGLVKFSAGVWSPVAVFLRNRSVQALQTIVAPGGRRELWIGTDGGGVARLDLSPNPRDLADLTDESVPPLPNNVVYQILQDQAGRVYVLTNRGVARLRWRLDGDSEFGLDTFTVDDGLASSQGNRGAGVVDRRGRIWVGTVAGASLFDPALEEDDRTPKTLGLAVLAGRNGESQLSDGVRLPSRHPPLVFSYALLSHFREVDTRYRTQLRPLEPEPSAWRSDWRREVGPLAAGAYVFRVWGRDYAGNVSGPVEFAFEVLPPPWKTWWAVGLYLLLAVGAVAAFVRLRSQAHHRRERALQDLIAARTRELTDANAVLSELSYLDSVTHIGNRRRFDERLDQEWRRAIRSSSPLSLIMIDIDFFKNFNDTFGHQRGDECLRAVAAALADGLPRAGDAVARYGGEEFVVILPMTERVGAMKLADALRQRVEELDIPHPSSSVASVVTISCGVATVWPSPDVEPAELVRLADESLYAAKHGGRNRTAAQHGPARSSVSLPAVSAPPS